METYIQYANINGQVKAVQVERDDWGDSIRYTLPTIQEQFFVLALFDGNKRVYGLDFVDIENVDMLAFINSEMQSIDALPERAFFNALQEVILEYRMGNTSSDLNVTVVKDLSPIFAKYQHPQFRYDSVYRFTDMNPVTIQRGFRLDTTKSSLTLNDGGIGISRIESYANITAGFVGQNGYFRSGGFATCYQFNGNYFKVTKLVELAHTFKLIIFQCPVTNEVWLRWENVSTGLANQQFAFELLIDTAKGFKIANAFFEVEVSSEFIV